MAEFTALSDSALDVDTAAFGSRRLDRTLSLLWSPAREVPLRSYCRFNAPNLPQRRRIFADLSYQADPVRLYRVPNARLVGMPIFIADEQGRIVRESVTSLGVANPMDSADEVLAAARARSPKGMVTDDSLTAKLSVQPGKYILAASVYGRNYYHWHVDLLTGVLAAKRLEILDEYKVLVMWDTEFTRGSLAALGVPAERVVVLTPGATLQFEELLFCTTARNAGMHMNPVVGETFDEIALTLPKAARRDRGRRVFVSRGASDRRLLVNRSAVEAAFADLGFEVIDPGSLNYLDQVATFHGADVVVGEHGGGLGNIGFCRPSALVVELFNPRHNDLCYLSLSEVQGLYHQILVGESEPNAGPLCEWKIDEHAAVRSVSDAIARWSWDRENIFFPPKTRPTRVKEADPKIGVS